MTARKVLATVLLLALVACGPTPAAAPTTRGWDEIAQPDGWNTIYRFIDEEAQVACWIHIGYKAGGISCLPLDETALDR